MINTILIVDDSKLARTFIRRCFEMAGLVDKTYIDLTNGDEAIKYLEMNKSVDLLVTDLNMPIKNGLELIESIKNNDLIKHIPIIVITSAGNTAMNEKLKLAGAFEVLGKPISPAIVSPVLKVLLSSGGI